MSPVGDLILLLSLKCSNTPNFVIVLHYESHAVQIFRIVMVAPTVSVYRRAMGGASITRASEITLNLRQGAYPEAQVSKGRILMKAERTLKHCRQDPWQRGLVFQIG